MNRRDFLGKSALLGSALGMEGCSYPTKTILAKPRVGSRSGRRVAILGGGVGGMTAAHELIEKGFEVTVFERKSIPGGKARSIEVSGSGVDGRRNLPGEHGFRFFPGFYRHVPDTMRRIPFGSNRNGVLDNLVPASQMHLSFDSLVSGRSDLHVTLEIQKILGLSQFSALRSPNKMTMESFISMASQLTNPIDWLASTQMRYLALKLLQVLNSSHARRMGEYELQSWKDFIGSTRLCADFWRLITGITGITVAARGDMADTNTIATVMLQLALAPFLYNQPFDRSLNGPTNDVWIDPWLGYLQDSGVNYQFNTNITALHLENGEISGFTMQSDGVETTSIDQFDYYIAAVPVEVMRQLLNPTLLAAAPELSGLGLLKTEWMTGIQYFLTQDVQLANGHTAFLDSPWALTSISQAQFWNNYDLSQFGNGQVKGILSVDISDWNTPNGSGKTAKECTKEEIAIEVFKQIKNHINSGNPNGDMLLDEMVLTYFLDPAIQFGANGLASSNDEPLFINTPNSWQHRPDAITSIPNFFLAADYVRNYTSLATMEGANEAARLAANGILSLSDSSADPCRLYPTREPGFSLLPKTIDALRYSRGIQHPLARAAENTLASNQESCS